MSLHGKEKIWYVFDRLIDAREESVGNIVGLHPADDLNRHFSHPDFINIIDKLHSEKVATFISLPTDQTYLKYQIKILSGFDAYHKKLWADPQYRKFSGDKYPPKGREPNKRYFDAESRIDFTLSSEQNKGRYISVGQIEELLKMPEDKRQKILDQNLTEENRNDVASYKGVSLKLVDDLIEKIKIQVPKLPDIGNNILSDVKYVPSPNYQAETVSLLKEIVASGDEQNKPDPKLITPSYLKDTKQLVFCNKIIDVSRGKDYALLCHSMFRSGKPIITAPQIGDLLFKWQDPDHKNSKRIRNAVSNLNNHIAKETTVKDLFKINNKHVYFNNKYI